MHVASFRVQPYSGSQLIETFYDEKLLLCHAEISGIPRRDTAARRSLERQNKDRLY